MAAMTISQRLVSEITTYADLTVTAQLHEHADEHLPEDCDLFSLYARITAIVWVRNSRLDSVSAMLRTIIRE
jgi:hypothetical protein